VESIWPERGAAGRNALNDDLKQDALKKVVLLSAQGRKFDQALAREFSALNELLLICGGMKESTSASPGIWRMKRSRSAILC